MAPRIVSVPLADLKTDLFVRASLNEDRVIYLIDLIQAGVELDPITITEDFRIIDGRHRYEAYQLLDKTEIPCVVDETITSETDLLAAAYKANAGGALPPSRGDTEHTIGLLLDRGTAQRSIAEMLNLPPSLARRYINQVKSRKNRQKMRGAIAAVTDEGLTVAAAADRFGVDPEELKTSLSGHRRKGRKDLADMQKALTSAFKSVSQKNAAFFRQTIDRYQDGDLSKPQVEELFRHVKAAQRRSARAVDGWESRFAAIASGSAAN